MTTILSSLVYKKIKQEMNGEVKIFDDVIFRLYDNATVTLSRTDSSDCQEYLAWLAEGNTPTPAES